MSGATTAPPAASAGRMALPNGTFTLVNRQRGTHRTLRIRTQPADARFAPGARILSLLNGPDNDADYLPFAFVDEHGIAVWRKHRKAAHSVLASILWGLAHGGHRWGDRVELRESRECVRCNRTLTDPESIELGIGPVCRRRPS